MRKIHCKEVLVNRKIFEHDDTSERLFALLDRVEHGGLSFMDDAEMRDYISSKPELGDRGGSGIEKSNPVVVFDASRWDGSDLLVSPLDLRRSGDMMSRHGTVCHDGYNIHTAYGCVNRCSYCCYGDVIYLKIDVDHFMGNLASQVEDVPALYKWDNRSDVMEFEPEMGFLPRMAELFSSYSKSCLMVYTKSGDPTEILKLEPSDQVIFCWTLSMPTQWRHMERGVASTQMRLEAAKQCQLAGHRVRLRLSPIVPVVGWEKELDRLIKGIFGYTLKPEVITLKTLGFMPTLQVFENMMGPVLQHLDVRFLNSIIDSSPDMKGNRAGPLPDHLREAIYRHAFESIRWYSDVPVSICNETPGVWSAMSDVLAISSGGCCCSNASVEQFVGVPQD